MEHTTLAYTTSASLHVNAKDKFDTIVGELRNAKDRINKLSDNPRHHQD